MRRGSMSLHISLFTVSQPSRSAWHLEDAHSVSQFICNLFEFPVLHCQLFECPHCREFGSFAVPTWWLICKLLCFCHFFFNFFWPENLGHGVFKYMSAVCWLFGRNLYDTLHYPIGLISSSWGGTPIEAWSSGRSLKTCGVPTRG